MYGRQPSMVITSLFSGAEPHSTGPMPGSSSGPTAVTTAAPAASPKSTQLDRSVQSVTSESFSEPMTSALRAAPARIAWSAVASAYSYPGQAGFGAEAAGGGMARFAPN